MSCSPQGYKIKVDDFLTANRNWLNWRIARYENTIIWVTEKALKSLLNKYILKLDYEVIRKIIRDHVNGKETIKSFFLMRSSWDFACSWREPDYEAFEANMQKAKLIQDDYMWVDWEVLSFMQKNINSGRNASGEIY